MLPLSYKDLRAAIAVKTGFHPPRGRAALSQWLEERPELVASLTPIPESPANPAASPSPVDPSPADGLSPPFARAYAGTFDRTYTPEGAHWGIHVRRRVRPKWLLERLAIGFTHILRS